VDPDAHSRSQVGTHIKPVFRGNQELGGNPESELVGKDFAYGKKENDSPVDGNEEVRFHRTIPFFRKNGKAAPQGKLYVRFQRLEIGRTKVEKGFFVPEKIGAYPRLKRLGEGGGNGEKKDGTRYDAANACAHGSLLSPNVTRGIKDNKPDQSVVSFLLGPGHKNFMVCQNNTDPSEYGELPFSTRDGEYLKYKYLWYK
jgi:hypothetical protein